MDIKTIIPIGHENAITIDSLMKMTGWSNRHVRKAIAESDATILNMQDGRGYFRLNPTTKAERAFAERYSAQEKSRGWAILKKAFAIDKKINAFANQGQIYRFARELYGQNQGVVAERLGVHWTFVSAVENGEIVPDDDYKHRFEELVGLKL